MSKPKTATRRLSPRLQLMKRIDGTLQVKTPLSLSQNVSVIPFRFILLDWSDTGLNVYVPTEIRLGLVVQVDLTFAQKISVQAEVIWCARANLNQKVLHAQSFEYRLGLRCLFASQDEEVNWKRFWQSIVPSEL